MSDRIREIESGTALVHVEGYVWCDKDGSVHSDTLNPYGYVEDGEQDYGQPEDHRPMFMEELTILVERGTPFVCHCRCHLPLGFRLMPGKAAPPSLQPCDKCKGLHP
jgi:hypothetical protein